MEDEFPEAAEADFLAPEASPAAAAGGPDAPPPLPPLAAAARLIRPGLPKYHNLKKWPKDTLCVGLSRCRGSRPFLLGTIREVLRGRMHTRQG